jgi:hypothetical protein
MKKVKLVLVAFAFLIIAPTASFALIDASVFGGYTFPSGSYFNTKGFQKGFDAHLNTDFLVIFKLGVGGFYRNSDIKITGNQKFSKRQVGIDAYGALSIPLMPVDPYLKFRSAVWDKVGGSYQGSAEHFKAYSWGIGALLTVLPVPGIISVGLYGEYLFDTSKNSGKKANGHTLNLGIRADLF